MDLTARLDLGELRLRTLLPDDAELLVEATRRERGRALWGPRPAGPYSLDDARTALQQWDPANTASQELARRAGYQLERRLPRQWRAWLEDDPARDQWHDCLIFAHTPQAPREP